MSTTTPTTIRCAACGHVLGKHAGGVVVVRHARREITVRPQAITIKCDKCGAVWAPRTDELGTLD